MDSFSKLIDLKISGDDLIFIAIALGGYADLVRLASPFAGDDAKGVEERLDAKRMAERLEGLSQRLIKANREGGETSE